MTASLAVPSKRRLFTCPGCGRTRQTNVRLNLCTTCYERQRPPRERHSLATCHDCGRTRWANHRRGLCPACYERQRRRTFACVSCGRTVEAPASFAALQTCPRCYSRARVVLFACPACGETRRTRPEGGVCRRCAYGRQMRVATCRACGQTRKAHFTPDGICHACRNDARYRRRGIPRAPTALPPAVQEARLLARLAPLRRAWVQAFLRTAYAACAPKTRILLLRGLVAVDAYLADATEVGPGQWSLVSPTHIESFLAIHDRFRLEHARPFLQWLHTRRHCRDLAGVLPRRPKSVRVRALPAGQVAEFYQRWTSDQASAVESLAGLLALLHCLNTGDLRHLRLDDVLGPDRLLVRGHVRELAPPVIPALARYRAWRAEWYAGPSRYLFVSAASRLHDRPVSVNWFSENVLGVPVADVRQTTIQQLIQALGCDALQVAAYTGLGLAGVQRYLRLFGRPQPAP